MLSSRNGTSVTVRAASIRQTAGIAKLACSSVTSTRISPTLTDPFV